MPVAVFDALRDAFERATDGEPTAIVTFGQEVDNFAMFFDKVKVPEFVYPASAEASKDVLLSLNERQIHRRDFQQSITSIVPAEGASSVPIRSKNEIYAKMMNVIIRFMSQHSKQTINYYTCLCVP